MVVAAAAAAVVVVGLLLLVVVVAVAFVAADQPRLGLYKCQGRRCITNLLPSLVLCVFLSLLLLAVLSRL